MEPFARFGAGHVGALALCVLIPAAVAYLVRRWPNQRNVVRHLLGWTLLALEIWWFIAFILAGSDLAHALPLQLSDASILLGAFVALTVNRWVFDVVYYWALTAMPLATSPAL